jgi:pimeloyl-ACP methyl ester carboxylesterase
MTTVTLPGMVLELEGEGDAVILLHGLGGTSNTWQPVMSALGGLRVVRPDLPGAGRSPVPDGAMSVRFLAESVVRAATALGIETAHIIGHSFGTLVAQHVAMAKPLLVRSLLLFGPIIEPGEAARERLRARASFARFEGMDAVADQVTPAGMASNAADENSAAFAFVRESHMRQDREGFAKSCEALASAHRAELGSLKIPVLAVTGDEDAISPPSVVLQVAAEISKARAEVIAGCGHWTPLEKPAECRRHIREFIQGVN